MDIYAARIDHEGSGSGGGGGIQHTPIEYNYPLHFHTVDTGDMSGGVETAGGVGVNEVMGTGHNGTGADMVGDGDRGGGG